MTTENTDIAKELRERSLRAEQEGEPCPDCGGETFRDEGRVTWCRDCGWNKSPSAFVGGLEGQWTFEKCPKCYV
jgi:ssDNA-binding Zn-finger/Zn-ribbon topoisomerase 1